MREHTVLLIIIRNNVHYNEKYKCMNINKALKQSGKKTFCLCKKYFVVWSQELHFLFYSWDSYNFQGFLQDRIYCTSPASEA